MVFRKTKAKNYFKNYKLSTSKLKVFVWKINVLHQIYHLIWQLVSGYVVVTGSLTRRHMRCDSHCPRCGEPMNQSTMTFLNAHMPCRVGPSLRHHRVRVLSQQ